MTDDVVKAARQVDTSAAWRFPEAKINPDDMIFDPATNAAICNDLRMGLNGSVWAHFVTGERVLIAQFNLADWTVAQVLSYCNALIRGVRM